MLKRLAEHIDRGLGCVRKELHEVQGYVACLRAVNTTLDANQGDAITRRAAFEELRQNFAAAAKDEVRQHMAKVMGSFARGLFIGAEHAVPDDNLDLERWFRLAKGHERHIHGRRHTGVRPVQEGPSLTLVLDLHRNHPLPLTATDLLPYRNARAGRTEQQAMHRRKVMRQARSTKARPTLLAELENRYRDYG